MAAPIDGLEGQAFLEGIEGGALTLELDAPEDAPPLEPYSDDDPNLVPFFSQTEDGKSFLRELGATIVNEASDALESSAEYRERISNNFKIYAGQLPQKEWPYKNASNPHLPIMLEVISRLVARMYAEIRLQDDMWFSFSPTGPDDDAAAEICTLHSNWQFKNKILDFDRQLHRGILHFVTNGDVTGHSFYDSRRGTNRHETLSVDDFIVPYVHTSVMPDWSDVPFKAKVLRLSKSEVEDMEGDWHGVDAVLEGRASYDDEPEAVVRQAIAEVQGVVPGDDDKHAPHSFYEYHGSAKLPGDKKRRHICAVVHVSTKAVVKLYIREEDDWQDRIRFERQMQEWESYQQATAQYEADSLEYPQAKAAYDVLTQQRGQLLQLVNQPGAAEEDEKGLLVSAMEADDPGPPPEPVMPVPPSWLEPGMEGPAPVKKVPMEMFSHGVCLENPLGVLGLSYGHILADHNRAANNAMAMFCDAAALANNWTLIVPDIIELEPGGIEIAPGKVNRVQNTGAQLRESIIELKPQPANPQLMEVVNTMYEFAQSSIAAPDALSGEPGKSGETYRGLATRIEQALKQLSVSGHKFTGWLTQILRNNAKLNSMFMPEEEIFFVADHIGQRADTIKASRRLYERNYQVTVRADMRFASQAQRIAEADQALGIAQQVTNMLAPMGVPPNLALIHAVTTKALKARNCHDLIPMLGPSPPAPPTPMGIIPPPPPGAAPPGLPPGPDGPPQPPMDTEGQSAQGPGGPAPNLQ